ncbi:MAG: hypothetical protein KKH98_14135, partial [Spirochaetes bacterium]|nr:hypothetical protein [Spirochaetota bacterium]
RKGDIMKKDINNTLDKVNYIRWTNKAINAKNDIARSFFEFSIILKQIKDNGFYDYKYNNFKEYCDNEIKIDWRTAYDYVKIADFVIKNNKVLSLEKAGLLGHKKLKLLSQKLTNIEEKYRQEILRQINEKESFTKLKERLENNLKTLIKTY